MTYVKPLVSILMPVFNADNYLEDAIISILNQTFTNYEFLIIDDGSTDSSNVILKKYAEKDSRIKILEQKNSGIVVALNRGLYEAKGNWIFRMDADDISLPNRIASQFNLLNNNSSLILVGGWIQLIDQNGKYIKNKKYPISHKKIVHAMEKGKCFLVHPSVAFHKKTVMEVGGYRNRFCHAEDTDLWLRMIDHGNFACIPEIILKLRKHKDNISNYNDGHTQKLLGIAARVCHFRRKMKLSDPAEFSEENWNKFLSWIEEELSKKGYFKAFTFWDNLRLFWYQEKQKRTKNKYYQFLKKLIMNPIQSFNNYYSVYWEDPVPFLIKKSQKIF